MSLLTLFITLLAVIYVGVCVIMILVILMQEGKSGGLAGSETAGQAPGALTDTFGAGGAQKTLFNTTAWLAFAFFTIALSLTLLGNLQSKSGGALDLGNEPAVTTPDGAAAPAGATEDAGAATPDAPTEDAGAAAPATGGTGTTN